MNLSRLQRNISTGKSDYFLNLIAKHLKNKAKTIITNCLTVYEASKTTYMEVGTNPPHPNEMKIKLKKLK